MVAIKEFTKRELVDADEGEFYIMKFAISRGNAVEFAECLTESAKNNDPGISEALSNAIVADARIRNLIKDDAKRGRILLRIKEIQSQIDNHVDNTEPIEVI